MLLKIQNLKATEPSQLKQRRLCMEKRHSGATTVCYEAMLATLSSARVWVKPYLRLSATTDQESLKGLVWEPSLSPQDCLHVT